jgi:hypothetical protein
VRFLFAAEAASLRVRCEHEFRQADKSRCIKSKSQSPAEHGSWVWSIPQLAVRINGESNVRSITSLRDQKITGAFNVILGWL